MREKFNHLYLDSYERKLLIHSLGSIIDATSYDIGGERCA